jgi:malate:quinone-oxidoreductase
MSDNLTIEPDVVLIGAGVMSATVGVFLKELEPSLTIEMFETLENCGLESSEAWNNAGTGHAANCEMNYTPERSDGSVDISKALEVNVEFDLSRQFWSYLVKKGAIADPRSFIHPVPHMSFVHGAGNVSFLRKRFKAMTAHHCYYGMEYSEDRKKIAEWVPLVMEGRTTDEPVAATRIVSGTDVDYGAVTVIWFVTWSGFQAARSIIRTALHTSPVSRMADGESTSWISTAAKSGRLRPNSSSSARVAAHCPCCRNQACPRAEVMAASRLVESGCAATTPR